MINWTEFRSSVWPEWSASRVPLARLLPIGIGTVCVLATLAPTLQELVRYWITIDNYSYGFLIALICSVWIPFSVREVVARGAAPMPIMLAPLAASLFAWYVFWQGNSMQGAQLLIPISLWFALTAMLGWRAGRALIVPVGYFYFAIPIWDQLLPLLQRIAIFGASASMKLSGVPYTVVGYKIVIPEGTFEVLTDCSGLRYLIVSTALAVLYGVMERMQRRQFIAFVALAAALAVVANWIRIFIVMYAGHVTKMEHYFVADSHLGLGNAVFAVLLVAIFALGRRMTRNVAPVIPANPAAAAPAASGRRSTLVAIVLLCAVTAALSIRAGIQNKAAANPQLKPLPVRLTNWFGPLPGTAPHSWMPRFADALDQRRVIYRSAGGVTMELYVNVYGAQRQGHELVYFEHNVAAPGSWERVRSHAAAEHAAATLSIAEFQDPSGTNWLLGQTYVVGGRSSISGIGAQLLYGFSTLTYPAPAGVIAVATRCQDDCRGALAQLNEFWRHAAEPLVASMPTQMPSPIQ